MLYRDKKRLLYMRTSHGNITIMICASAGRPDR